MFWSVVGYISSFLVLFSLMFKNPFKFRVINALGAIVSCVYSFFAGAYPMVLMNAGIFLIDAYFLFCLIKEGKR